MKFYKCEYTDHKEGTCYLWFSNKDQAMALMRIHKDDNPKWNKFYIPIEDKYEFCAWLNTVSNDKGL